MSQELKEEFAKLHGASPRTTIQDIPEVRVARVQPSGVWVKPDNPLN